MASDWGTSDDIEQYRRDFSKFLERIAIASEGNPPPGANAANGWFIKAVRDDAEIKSVAPPRAKADDPQAEKVFSIIASFEARILEAFKTPNHKSSWTKSGKLAFDALDKIKGDLTKVAASIVPALKLDPAALAALAKSIDDLIKKVHSAGIQYEGEHANGYISPAVVQAAKQAKTSFESIANGSGGDPLAVNFAKAAVKIMDDIIKMETIDHEPWLTGEWQIKIQGICRMGSELLLEVRA